MRRRQRKGLARPTIIAVTVLTSIDDAELARMGIGMSPREMTKRLAVLDQGGGP